jgi:DNA-binding CsgD family transcriptional regulator
MRQMENTSIATLRTLLGGLSPNTRQGISMRPNLYKRKVRASPPRRPRQTRSLSAWDLTPREKEVLQWLAKGKSNPSIGAILGISPRTVQTHLTRIYEKLGVETRTQAIILLHERGVGGRVLDHSVGAKRAFE